MLLTPTSSRVNIVLALHAGAPLRASEITRLLDLYPNATRVALKTLVRAGIARTIARHGHDEYALETTSSYADVARRLALVDLDLRSLLPEDAKILAIFAYGSVPEGRAQKTSDLDLFMVGKVDQRVVDAAFRPVEELIGRTLDVVIRPAAEVRRLVEAGDSLTTQAMDGVRLWGTWS
jgi:hypothetical protein